MPLFLKSDLKNKFAFHITTALHDSRTSQRMIDYHARARRFNGTKPLPEVFPLTAEEEELIASIVADIVKEDKLIIAAFNLCWDHMHILLICEEEEVPKIMQKIKAKTARAVNILRWKTIVTPREPAPLAGAVAPATIEKRITQRGKKQNSLWTQKFGCKKVYTEKYFWNALNYIEKNKAKHKLPNNPKLATIIQSFVKNKEECF